MLLFWQDELGQCHLCSCKCRSSPLFGALEAERRFLPQSFYAASAAASTTTPIHVLALRFLAFLSCSILIAMALYGSGNPFSPEPAGPPPALLARNGTEPVAPGNGTLLGLPGWREMIHLLPEQLLVVLSAAWSYGKNHQVAVVALGLLMCISAMLLAGRIRYVGHGWGRAALNPCLLLTWV